ncbi:helix-turn-helix domain-containing protein, partial [Salmonella enterica subsp. enterica serovar Javiana]|uniref:helix-turn-helix domain-containing protein n=1 Tax=Salmonella enterica TaxID=28901 RepID=UPI00214AB20B
LGCSKMTISNLKKTGIPPDHIRSVFELTGVAPHELRPDLYPNPTDALASQEASAK